MRGKQLLAAHNGKNGQALIGTAKAEENVIGEPGKTVLSENQSLNDSGKREAEKEERVHEIQF